MKLTCISLQFPNFIEVDPGIFLMIQQLVDGWEYKKRQSTIEGNHKEISELNMRVAAHGTRCLSEDDYRNMKYTMIFLYALGEPCVTQKSNL